MNELVYVEMVCDLAGYNGETDPLPPEYTLHPFGKVDVAALYACYLESFAVGESVLFHR